MAREAKTSLGLIVASILLASGIFFIDLLFPLGVAGGVPYVALVLLSLWAPNKRFTWGAATIASVLTVLGFLLSAPGGVVWVVLVNRSLALFVIWVTAILCLARMRAEGTLRLQGQIVERMVEGVIVIRPADGIILFCSPPFERMFGYDSGELVGQPVAVVNAVGETSPQETADTIIHSLNETGSWTGEVYNVKKDGDRFWCHAVVSTLDHPEFGRVWVALHEDVTEHKQAKEALRAESERNQRILAGAMDGFVTLDLDGRFCDVNAAYCAIVGCSRDELLAMSIQDVEAQETAEETAQHIEMVLKTGHDRFESKMRRNDGRLIDVEVSANLIDVGGNAQICSFIRDVTERKCAEQTLQESEKRYRNLFHQAPISLWEEDFSALATWFDELRETGVGDLREYLQDHPEAVQKAARLIRVVDVNEGTLRLFGVDSMAELLSSSLKAVEEQRGSAFSNQVFAEQLVAIWEGQRRFETEFAASTPEGAHIDCLLQWVAPPQAPGKLDLSYVIIAISDITERKRAEEKLRESDARFRAIFEGAGIGMALADMDGRLVESNATFQQMLGYEAQELRGRVFTDFTHPEDVTVDMALYKELEARKRHHYQIGKRYIRKDGQLVYGRLTVSLVHGNGAKPQFAIGMVEDITARKQAEEALRESENRFRTTFESAAIAMALDDEQGRLIETNSAFQKMFGYSAQELEGMAFSKLTHPEDIDRGWDLFKELVQDKRDSFHLRKRYYRKDGTLLWGSVNVSAIRNGNGSFRHSVTMIEDITAHRLAEDALRASESRFRGLLEAEPDDVVVVDEAGRITLVNTKAAKMFGYRREELFGKPVELLVPQPLREKHVGHRAAFLNQPRARPMGTELEVTGRRKDGSEFPADVSLSPLETDEGLFVMSIIRDITQRKRAEQALRFTQFAVDHNSDATYWVRSDGRISYVNQAACQALGYSYQELVSLRVPDIDLDFPDDIWAAHFLKVKEAGSLTFEAHHRTKSGRQFPVEILANYLAYDDQEYLCAYARDITERKRAELVLRESEERFRVVFESAPFGMVVVDAAGTPLRYNRAFQEMLGYSEQELREKDVSEYTHPDDVEDTRRLFAELRQGKRDLYQLDKRYVRKDGEIVWGSLAFTSVRDAQGDVQYLIATVKDITERKQAEEALRDMNDALANAMPGISRLDTSGRYVMVNNIYAQMMGYDPDELIGADWNLTVHPEDRPHALESYERMLSEGTAEFEARGVRKDGTILHKQVLLVRIDDKRGSCSGHHCFMRDITERKQAEQALTSSEERFALALDATSEGLWDWNIATGEMFYSPRWCKALGFDPSEVEPHGRFWESLVHPDDLPRFYEVLNAHFERKTESFECEVRLRTKSGEYRWILDRGRVVGRDEEGKPLRMVGVDVDITEHKRAEEQARQLQADLAHMSRLSSMGEMASGLAHELNQPLTVITNYAQGCVRRLKSNAIDPEELGDILGRIAIQARRSSSIIRGLGNLVRKSSALRFEIDINHCIMEVADLANAEATQHRAKARFELEPNLPLVMADQTQLQQVILNLVQNGCEAIQDTPESRRAVTVRTKRRGDRELEILVSDNGRGISEPLGERLFEPFFTTKAQGIGMGLAISRSIVEAHGGRLWVTPNRREGTTFHFTLPIVGGHSGDE